MFVDSLKSGGIQDVVWDAVGAEGSKDGVGAEVKEGGEIVMGREGIIILR